MLENQQAYFTRFFVDLYKISLLHLAEIFKN